MRHLHKESHLVERIGWLSAAVLGANDGIISTASLILGVAAAAATKSDILLAGVAGLVAGAMSMAAGEYVSVSSQSDTEQADLAREGRELSEDPEFEKEELAQIYVGRGVEIGLARQVAQQLMVKDALGAHARDELGISEITSARPVPAAPTENVDVRPHGGFHFDNSNCSEPANSAVTNVRFGSVGNIRGPCVDARKVP